MKDFIIKSAIAELSPEDFTHPSLRRMKFIFCDDQPNENGMGIEYEDFAAIKKSAIGTPLKMKFFGNNVGNHLGSIPIGYIENIYEAKSEDGHNQLVADSILFSEEYPEEIDWLYHQFNEGKAPGVSWELKYEDSILKDGIDWLKGVITKAATIVRNPAYGNRTAILALASNKDIEDDQFMKVISEIVTDNSPKNSEKGGSNSMDEKELKELQDRLASLEAQISEKDTTISELQGKVTDLETAVSEKDTTIADYQHKELVASRTEALVEAGIKLPEDPEKLAAKQQFFVGLSEEAFETYKTDLEEAIAEAKKEQPKEEFASLRTKPAAPKLPRLEAAASTADKVDVGDLRSRMKSYSRTVAQPE